MPSFIDTSPSLENYWRTVILFGRNVAAYKFARVRTLLDLEKKPNDLVTLEELALASSVHMVEIMGWKCQAKRRFSPAGNWW